MLLCVYIWFEKVGYFGFVRGWLESFIKIFMVEVDEWINIYIYIKILLLNLYYNLVELFIK